MARLNFAISTCLHPEILIIDEGIGAGDAEFQEAAKQRINEIMGVSKIVIIASHSPDIINTYCNKVITFDKGSIVNVEVRRQN
jgi:ABC-type polysaccharide/polyol phosphate transport system ATPase subunit